jgi:hypothetical protein
METGEVDFTVTSDNFNEAASVQFELENDKQIESIISGIEGALPVTVENYDVNNDVAASIEFTVDADDANNDLTQAAWQSEQLLSDFDVSVENAYITQAPTVMPSKHPSTSLPTSS